MVKVAGRIPVLECLRAGRRRAHRLYLVEGGRDLGPLRTAARGLPVQECTRRELDVLAEGAVHQGVILEADPLPLLEPAPWLARETDPDAVVVALDGVEDPHNFGAIVRSAAAFGARAVLFAKDRAAPVSPASVKSAAGAMEYVDLIQATNLARALEEFKRAGFWTVALDADGPQSLWEAGLDGRVVLVIGAEGTGLRRLVRERCDFLLRIPIAGPITSLNASVSAAVALAECVRQRNKAREAQ